MSIVDGRLAPIPDGAGSLRERYRLAIHGAPA